VVETIDLDRHAVIDASAGTGKTYTIEHLVLRLLVERGVPLHQILVVTFTEKATGELKERLRRAVERELVSPRRPSAVPLLRASLDAFDDAPIFTIHAFCHRVLGRFAFENAHPFKSPLVDDAPLREKRLREMMRRRFGIADGSKLLDLLRAADYPGLDERGESRWERSVRSLAASFRPHGGDRVLPEVGDLLAADRAALEAVGVARACVAELVGPVDPADPAANAFAAAYRRLNINAATRRSRLDKLVLPALKALGEHPAGAGEGLGPFVAAFEEVVAGACSYKPFGEDGRGFAVLGDLKFNKNKDNPEACPNVDAVALQLDVIRREIEGRVANLAVFAATRLQRDLDEFKRERGQISYDDMIRRVDASLDPARSPTGAPLLVAALRNCYRYALVDEFQDTDSLQWRVFKRLFVDSTEGHRLAVVGDPKQAIYGFRNADLGAYQEAVRQLTAECGAERYALGVNWRSMPEMVDALNAMFARGQWFDVPLGDPLQYAPVGAPPTRSRRARLFADRTGRHPVTAVRLPPAQRAQSVFKEGFPGYARFVAREIKRLLTAGPGGAPLMEIADAAGRPVPLAPDHVCILVQRAKEVPPLEKALRREGVPHAWYKKPGLWQSEEALHLSKVLRAVAEPGDAAATRKALLTRFFHVARGDGTYGRIGLDRLHHYEGLPPTHPVRRTLQRWQDLARRREWPALFRGMLQGTGLLLDETLEADGDRRVANHLQIAEQLQAEALGEALDIHRLVARVDGYRNEYFDADEDANVHRLETSEPRVLILTVHKAKGLEFPVVFVAGGLTDPPKSGYLKYHDGGRVVYDLRPDSPMKAKARAEAESESRRLYYVACTRAAYKLYLPYYRDDQGRYVGGPGLQLMSRSVDACDAACHVGRASASGDGDGADPTAGAESTWAPSLDIRPPPASGGSPASAAPAVPCLPTPDHLFPTLPGPFHHRVRPIVSFTSLAHRYAPARPLTVEDDARLEDDHAWDEEDEEDEQDDRDESESTDAATEGLGFGLPGGKKTGTLVHDILEHADFGAVASADRAEDLLAGPTAELIDKSIRGHFPAAARVLETQEAYRRACARLLFGVLRASLPEVGRLCDVRPTDRLTEVEFHFPVGDGPASHAVARATSVALPPGIGVDSAGYLTGKIDLVFRAAHRCYLVDWKSNTLAHGYGRSAVAAAMEESRYDLQRAIYAAAVTRLLRGSARPVPFGGAFYLFLRGMGVPGGPPDSGVCFAAADALSGAEDRLACAARGAGSC
jgi:exodeoxyribonuclease V beta subunit